MAFIACNATAGTGITAAITTSFSATAAWLNIRNDGQKKIRPRRIRMTCRTVAASMTEATARFTMDTGTARYASGGTQLTAVNTDMTSTTASGAVVRAGALVLNAASSSVRTVAQFQFRNKVEIIGDQYTIDFCAGGGFNYEVGTASVPTASSWTVEPVVIGPGQDFNMHTYRTSNAATAGVYEIEVVWDETR